MTAYKGENEGIYRELTEHIIPFWSALRDDTNGGYYGYMSYDLILDREAVKGCILNSRITWFFSNAYMLLSDEALLENARHGYEFLREHCLDRNFPGVYWSVDFCGDASDTTKHTYNQAFAIYALSSYFDASGDVEALREAMNLYYMIEEKCRDEHGYLEAFDREFRPVSNEKLSENGVIAKRTMNTLLHVIEGYTELYRVSHFPEVGRKLAGALDILHRRIYNPDRHRLEVFFDDDYHSLIDLYSYGHDIEASWLVDRAISVLMGTGPSVFRACSNQTNSSAGEECSRAPFSAQDYYGSLAARIRPILSDLTFEVYTEAFDGHSLPAECERGIVKENRIWWVQAENLLGLLNGYLRDGKVEYLRAAKSQWQYIRDMVVDKRQGSEWFWELHRDGTPIQGRPIVEPWKCPYHDGRMCMEVLRSGVKIE